jgi:hypothetical protein
MNPNLPQHATLDIFHFGHKSALTQTDMTLHRSLKALQNKDKSALTQIAGTLNREIRLMYSQFAE